MIKMKTKVHPLNEKWTGPIDKMGKSIRQTWVYQYYTETVLFSVIDAAVRIQASTSTSRHLQEMADVKY